MNSFDLILLILRSDYRHLIIYSAFYSILCYFTLELMNVLISKYNISTESGRDSYMQTEKKRKRDRCAPKLCAPDEKKC